MTHAVDVAKAPAGDEVVMTMLHDHVPLSLLCDLQAVDGPGSAEILALEGAPAVRWWERA